jgi:hypothetical protein
LRAITASQGSNAPVSYGGGGGIGPPLSSGLVDDQSASSPAPAPAAGGMSEIFTPKNMLIGAGLIVGTLVLKKVLHA